MDSEHAIQRQEVPRRGCEVANRYAEGRIVSMLEGGYALSALGRSVAVHIEALLAGHPAANG